MVDLKVPRICGCKTSTNHYASTTVLDSWEELFVLMVFIKHSMHYGQTLWPRINTLYIERASFRRLVVCSDIDFVFEI